MGRRDDLRIADRRFERAPRSFFEGDTRTVARRLIGAVLAHRTNDGVAAGRIVEVEAYLAEDDEASHSFRGRTARNASMFGPPGLAYVYLVYGVHHCFNVVTAEEGRGEAVLVRALEPFVGLELMRARRGTDDERLLCNGPGKLVQALAIARRHDGVDLTRGELGVYLEARHGSAPRLALARGPRIGITRSRDLALRTWLRASPWISRA